MMKIRIHGIDSTIRDLAKTNDDTFDSARRGVKLSAEHLMEKIISKFGVYQKTGGDNNGPWKKLAYETIKRKLRKGQPNKPLIATGNTMDSFSIKMGGKGRLSATVISSSETLIHHVYGAPNAGVPKRDPMLITADEERNVVHDIIIDEIWKEIK